MQKSSKDIIRLVDGYDIQDAINSAYTVIIVLRDTAFLLFVPIKRANHYNEWTKT
jgi:hypothetical protein